MVKVYLRSDYANWFQAFLSREQVTPFDYEVEMSEEDILYYEEAKRRYADWQTRIFQLIKEQEDKVGERITRKLASIQMIDDLQPIDGADAIEVASILGWKVVVKKGDFEIGDMCVYCEIDSVMPDRPEFEFLRDKKFRIKTIKLRGQISQGIAFPLDIAVKELHRKGKLSINFHIGDDFTEFLGVTKWDPPEMIGGNGEAAGGFPSQWISKTDEIRIQSIPEIIDEIKNVPCYISEKADGTSATYLLDPYGEYYVCSRNLRIKNGDNMFWDISRKYNILDILVQEAKKNRYLCIQGEMVGPGIQGNKLGLKNVELQVFNVFDIVSHRYFDYKELIDFCNSHGLKTVKITAEDMIFNDHNIDDFIWLAKGTYENGHPREGIVIRPMVEMNSNVLNGRLSFKVINNDFLLKEK